LRSAFPDLHYEEHEIISQGNKVIFVGTITGTHKGNLFFIPPTGNKVSYDAVHIYTIGDDGKIIEHKAVRDDLKFMMQLGVIKPASEFETYIKECKGTVIQSLWAKDLLLTFVSSSRHIIQQQ
jgi:hypothetical protein